LNAKYKSNHTRWAGAMIHLPCASHGKGIVLRVKELNSLPDGQMKQTTKTAHIKDLKGKEQGSIKDRTQKNKDFRNHHDLKEVGEHETSDHRQTGTKPCKRVKREIRQ